MIKELRFELSLDDPRLVTENKILLKGDRQQLEYLFEVVTDYVQNFLQQTNPVFDFAPTQNIYTYQTQGSTAANIATIARPQLETKGLLSHRLHLGRLANEVSGQTIQLSATQLYDLANALESYSAEMVALPTLTANQNRKNVMRWGAIAASFLVVIGISKTAFDMQQAAQNETAASLEAVEESPADFEQQVVPPNLHSSYSFSEVPELEESLTAEKADPTNVNLAPINANQRPAASGNSNDSSTASSSEPSPETGASPQPRVNAPQPPAIASSPTAIIPRTAGSAPGTSSLAPASPVPSSSVPQTSRSAAPQEAPASFDLSTGADTYSGELAATPVLTGDRLNQTQQFFDANWQTPEGLGETLEYRLNIDESGTLQRVVPLGKAAELYQNRLSYLTTGEQIVNPTGVAPQTIRLVLDPDGTVQTFEEPPINRP